MADKFSSVLRFAAGVIAIGAVIAFGYSISGGAGRTAAAGPSAGQNVGRRIPGPEVPPERLKTATFGAGCFWGVEAVYRNIPGVVATDVGYLGGTLVNPTYEQVCTGRTGHAEVVQVTYDSGKVSYRQLLDAFWANHDPTTLNRQGPDVGTQYRSAIFFHDEDQRRAALASKAALAQSRKFRRPIVTEITPASAFYRAEDYHQQYLEKRGLATCHVPTG